MRPKGEIVKPLFAVPVLHRQRLEPSLVKNKFRTFSGKFG